MTKTTVLVTGATGRIGGAVATQLLEKGITTRARCIETMRAAPG